jgi:hypothetical protein
VENAGELLTAAQMRRELENQVRAAGGKMAWCRRHELSHTPVSLMLGGKRPVSEAVANALGFICETRFRSMRRKNEN